MDDDEMQVLRPDNTQDALTGVSKKELQNANVELLSGNLELQSLVEELEAGKEEMQANNEALHSLNEQITAAGHYAESIVATISEPLLVLDKHLRVKTANNAFYKTFQVNKQDTEGVLIYDLGNKQWDNPSLRMLLEEILPLRTDFTDFEVAQNFKGIGEKMLILNARRIEQKTNGEHLILLAIHDVTEIRMKTFELRLKEKELRNKDISERKAEKIQLEKIVAERTKELEQVNKELVFQNKEKEKRAGELIIANKELVFQNGEKEKRAGELVIANKELVFQNEEKEKRAAELIIANKELAFQNEEKEKRAAELIIANKELLFQNEEKEKRAAELIIANRELAFQNEEKEKRAAELFIANNELVFQNKEKEKRAAELFIANKELAFQNEEKEKRAEELIIANKELVAFTYISSHDLQEPLRKIQTFAARILDTEYALLSDNAKNYFNRMYKAAQRMQTLILDLLSYSHTSIAERVFIKTSLTEIVEDVKNELTDAIREKNAFIEAEELCEAYIDASQFRQLIYNMISNALKFSKPGVPPHIIITGKIYIGSQLQNENLLLQPGRLSPEKKYCHLKFADNGIGFEVQYKDKIFEVFQRLHNKEAYEGTGIGLAIVKKIVENHNGVITATGELTKGATFNIYIPA